jgi:RimJ/RimL family protein N-acetyltransferase
MIKGEFVGLRAVEETDLEKLRDWRNNEDFRRNFREIRELNLINQKNWFDKTSNNANDFMFIIIRLSDNEPIGACGLLYTNWVIRSADFSFYIGVDDQYIDNQGYAEEASRLLIDYGFKSLNLHKIWMELYEFDSIKYDFFTRKFQFELDGVLRDNCFEDGRYWNSFLISLINNKIF